LEYKKRDIVVLGISPDDEASHAAFATKHNLGFTLLSDPTHDAATRYGVWGKKTAYGKTYIGITRATFLIDEDGRIMRIFPKASPEGHAADVLAAFGDR
ncbi:MAG: redoxin domain-containing protein, partial [Nanoarchaeota archaeon]